MRRVLLFFVLLGLPAWAEARMRVFGWAEQGGKTAQTIQGALLAIPKVQASFPLCTITIFQAGTVTLATIYADNAGTVKANPFTADTNGYWFFYGDSARYDVRVSGTGVTTPFT